LEFRKTEERLKMHQDSVNLFTLVGTKLFSGSSHILDKFLSLISHYHHSL
jgi:hypothetical protein